MLAAARAIGVFALLTSGCVPGELDLEGRACPCAEGWSCDEARDVCVRGQASDGGAGDAGRGDAGRSDAGRTDAGRSDAGPRDASHDAPIDAGHDAGDDAGRDAGVDPTGCDDVHAGAIFCDGFEGADFAGWDSSFATSGTVTRSTARTYRGDGALRAATTSASGEVGVRSVAPGAATSGELYLRAYVYVPSSVVITNSISLMQIGHDSAPWEHVGLSIDGPSDSSMYLTTDGGSAWRPGRSVPRDEWVCLELHVTASETAGVAEYWMNGALEGRATGVDSVPGRGFERFVIGIPYAPPDQPSAEIFVDEVVYDDGPIGCD